MAKFDAAAALSWIEGERVTMLAEFPPILTSLLDAAESRPAALASLRIATGLDSPETITRFERQCTQARFWSVFGQSETSGFVTMDPFRNKPGAAGRPAVLATVAVVDDKDKPVPVGEIGEIAVRGPTVFQGYWNCRRIPPSLFAMIGTTPAIKALSMPTATFGTKAARR